MSSMRFTIILLFALSIGLWAQQANISTPLPPKTTPKEVWVDSIYQSLSIDKKIAQLYMIAAYSGGEKYNQADIEKAINQHGIGGLIFMQGTASAQALQTNKYQQISKVPLWIAMDAEWGLGMRLKGIKDMPRQIMMGAMKDSNLVYNMAVAVADQCRRLGVHINFAPVADINNNPNNPVINFRSFGENKYRVANYCTQYMMGLQDNGIIACAKHFPGHGDTETDSHQDLPTINKSLQELHNLEFYPFAKLIENKIQSVMIAHLQVPSLDNRPNTPTTLSHNTVTKLLKETMGFKGLVFTDALNMQGVAKFFAPGEIDLRAFEAGNDVLLFSQDIPSGIEKIKAAIQSGKIPQERLEESVKKILSAKYDAGLNNFININIDSIDADINKYTTAIRKQIAENAITLIADPHSLLDKLKQSQLKNFTYVAISSQTDNTIISELKKMGLQDVVFVKDLSKKEIKKLHKHLKDKELIIGLHNMSGYPTNNFGLDENLIQIVKTLNEDNKAINILFGNPYALKNFCDISSFIIAYDDAEETQLAVSKIITGQLKAKGKLPVTICKNFKAGDGIVSITNILGEVSDTVVYRRQIKKVNEGPELVKQKLPTDIELTCCVSPDAVGADNKVLDKLDAFIENSIAMGALPGCRILASKNGKVFYDRAFGFLTQERKNRVDINTVYDLASLTKITATTMAIMKLYDKGKIDINENIGKYLPTVKGSDKEYLKIKDILLHQAGLKSWIPFYKETVDENAYPKAEIYSKTLTGKFKIKVADNLYMHEAWLDTLWKRILTSPLENRGKYVYSDLDFILLQKLAEHISQKKLDVFLYEEFYKPLEMNSTVFNPRIKAPNLVTAPTEMDNYFRQQKINGYVHDMGAAMLGGVGGHAGLFSTPNDIAILMQMLLNGGVYNGKRYLQKSTIDMFTAHNSNISRRALGFDKPEMQAGKSSPCCSNASDKTFGHTGFTGTCVWADPKQQLIFVFLSNRTYPSANNKLINSMNVRERAHQFIYQSLGIAPKKR